ncbi:MAG: hypothetical protein ACI83P_002746, partial [Janthinobacterium sp.]
MAGSASLTGESTCASAVHAGLHVNSCKTSVAF